MEWMDIFLKQRTINRQNFKCQFPIQFLSLAIPWRNVIVILYFTLFYKQTVDNGKLQKNHFLVRKFPEKLKASFPRLSSLTKRKLMLFFLF